MKRRTIVCALMALMAIGVWAEKQKGVKVISATYTYYPPGYITYDHARTMAVERAKIQALADEFGTYVSQTNRVGISSSNAGTSQDFHSFGLTEVKGVWLETIGEPKIQESSRDGKHVIVVEIKGRACPVTRSDIDLDIRVMRNGDRTGDVVPDFLDGDQMRLMFRSPVEGYLAIYLLDGEGQAYCLLPYRNQNGTARQVKANRQYLLFDHNRGDLAEDKYEVEAYNMTTAHAVEANEIYVIFSPNKFSKALDDNKDDKLPAVLAIDDFFGWLGKCRVQDAEMQLERIPIVIRKGSKP